MPLFPLKSLSPHFTLAEMARTDVRDLPNAPDGYQLECLFLLCLEYLEPVRDRFGPLRINSGLRVEAVNARIGGSKTSSHRFGCAADFDPLDPDVTNEDVIRWLRDESGLDFDQAIDEHSSRGPPGWVHLGIASPVITVPRRQCLVYRNGIYTAFPE